MNTIGAPHCSGTTPNVFSLPLPFRNPVPRAMAAAVIRPLEAWAGLASLNDIYRHIPDCTSSGEFFERAMELIELKVVVTPDDLARVPKQGPLVIVANHPFGAIEGLVIGKLMRGVRSDFKFMANFMLSRIPEIQEAMISVDPFGGPGTGKRNLRPLRQSIEWLRGGHALCIFPAGEVAHPRLRPTPQVTDPVWNQNVGGLIRRSGAPVLPVFFPGGNSLWFHALGLLHPRLRTALLPRELLRKRGGTIEVRIGRLISGDTLSRFSTAEEATDYLRLRTFLLKSRTNGCLAAPAPARRGLFHSGRTQPVAVADAAHFLSQEVKTLPQESLIVETEDFAVHCVHAPQIPLLLREIGRQREITFRNVGEGTGRTLDLDRFDVHYQHLFAWNKSRNELVGAYRLGKVDEILRTHDLYGLYTQTLFKYRRELLDRLGPALELGRSFIRPKYQRSFAPLLLLWKGIGQVVARNPDYKYLLGAVSISNDYRSLSRQLLVAFLRANRLPSILDGGVSARHPLKIKSGGGINPCRDVRLLSDLDEVSELISDLEPDGKGVPVLLRQYMKLGGVILDLNVDSGFNNCLDGLILVDLEHTAPRLLDKYLGREGAASFLARHRKRAPSAA